MVVVKPAQSQAFNASGPQPFWPPRIPVPNCTPIRTPPPSTLCSWALYRSISTVLVFISPPQNTTSLLSTKAARSHPTALSSYCSQRRIELPGAQSRQPVGARRPTGQHRDYRGVVRPARQDRLPTALRAFEGTFISQLHTMPTLMDRKTLCSWALYRSINTVLVFISPPQDTTALLSTKAARSHPTALSSYCSLPSGHRLTALDSR